MERVLRELETVRKDPAPDPVHDLRVAIRRCRSVGAVFQTSRARRATKTNTTSVRIHLIVGQTHPRAVGGEDALAILRLDLNLNSPRFRFRQTR